MTPQQLMNLFEDRAAKDAGYAIAFAIIRLADATQNLSTNVKFLGNGDASTSMGAIEAYGLHIGEKLDHICDAIAAASESSS